MFKVQGLMLQSKKTKTKRYNKEIIIGIERKKVPMNI